VHASHIRSLPEDAAQSSQRCGNARRAAPTAPRRMRPKARSNAPARKFDNVMTLPDTWDPL
jgi:hypothetical protein